MRRFLAILLLAPWYGAMPQSPAGTPRFEVVSVKPSVPGATYRGTPPPTPSRIRIENISLRSLILQYYQLHSWELKGGPAWMASAQFDIEAKTAAPATREQMRIMMQSLLADRFQLKFHREKREQAIYNLLLAKTGAKLPEPKEGGCLAIDQDSLPVPPTKGRGPIMYPCGNVRFELIYPVGELNGGKVRMATLVSRLIEMFGRPVHDLTEFTRAFDIHMRFALDDALGGYPMFHRAIDESGASEPAGAPTVLVALRDQLGLRIEPAKGMAEIFVVDSAQTPAAN